MSIQLIPVFLHTVAPKVKTINLLLCFSHKNNFLIPIPSQEFHNHHRYPSSKTSLKTNDKVCKRSKALQKVYFQQGQRKVCVPQERVWRLRSANLHLRAVLKGGVRHFPKKIVTMVITRQTGAYLQKESILLKTQNVNAHMNSVPISIMP